MSTHWLSEDERAAWLRFAALIELLPGVLNAQLTRDENLTHFDYSTLAMLSEAPQRTLRMTELAALTMQLFLGCPASSAASSPNDSSNDSRVPKTVGPPTPS